MRLQPPMSSARATARVLRVPRLGNLAARRETIVLLLLVFGSIVFAATHPAFLSAPNVEQILSNVAVIAIVAIGMTLVIVTGGIDVSVGSTLALCMLVSAKVMASGGGVVPSLGAGIATGVVVGALNGALIAYGGVHPIIITLGTLNIIRALHVGLLGPQWLTPPPVAKGLTESSLLGLPGPWWLVMMLGVVATYFVTRRPLGRAIYAVGGSSEAARLAGINVRAVTFFVYATMGALVGLAAFVQLGQSGTVQPNAGIGVELGAIAATVIGGASILGGRGTIVGAVLGALLVEAVHNALITIGTISLLEGLVVGVLILVAVGSDVLQHRRERLT